MADEVFGQDISFKSDFIVTPSGDLELISGTDNLRAALFRRLITYPGAIIHRPEYGVGIQRYLNAPNSQANQLRLLQDIREQFEREVRIESIEEVRITGDIKTPETVKIYVRVKPVGFQEAEITFIPFGA